MTYLYRFGLSKLLAVKTKQGEAGDSADPNTALVSFIYLGIVAS